MQVHSSPCSCIQAHAKSMHLLHLLHLHASLQLRGACKFARACVHVRGNFTDEPCTLYVSKLGKAFMNLGAEF